MKIHRNRVLVTLLWMMVVMLISCVKQNDGSESLVEPTEQAAPKLTERDPKFGASLSVMQLPGAESLDFPELLISFQMNNAYKTAGSITLESLTVSRQGHTLLSNTSINRTAKVPPGEVVGSSFHLPMQVMDMKKLVALYGDQNAQYQVKYEASWRLNPSDSRSWVRHVKF